MISTKNKIKLSPQLKMGVGRRHRKLNLFKIFGSAFLILAAIMAINSVRLIRDNAVSTSQNSQVLGAEDAPFTEYTVQKGDTIFVISQRCGVNWSTVATVNNLASPFTLKPGQKLKIPCNNQ